MDVNIPSKSVDVLIHVDTHRIIHYKHKRRLVPSQTSKSRVSQNYIHLHTSELKILQSFQSKNNNTTLLVPPKLTTSSIVGGWTVEPPIWKNMHVKMGEQFSPIFGGDFLFKMSELPPTRFPNIFTMARDIWHFFGTLPGHGETFSAPRHFENPMSTELFSCQATGLRIWVDQPSFTFIWKIVIESHVYIQEISNRTYWTDP